SVMRISSMTSLCPMMRLPSSAMICCRPTFILSANAMSSGESKSTVLVSSTVVPLVTDDVRLMTDDLRLVTDDLRRVTDDLRLVTDDLRLVTDDCQCVIP